MTESGKKRSFSQNWERLLFASNSRQLFPLKLFFRFMVGSLLGGPFLFVSFTKFADDTSGIATDKDVFWHIFGNDGTSSDDTILPDGYTRENRSLGANPNIVTDCDRQAKF